MKSTCSNSYSAGNSIHLANLNQAARRGSQNHRQSPAGPSSNQFNHAAQDLSEQLLRSSSSPVPLSGRPGSRRVQELKTLRNAWSTWTDQGVESENRTEALARLQQWSQAVDPETILDLSNLNLKELPAIPSFLRKLDISGNSLTRIKRLPNHLRTLSAANNKINQLPRKIPEQIKSISLKNNQIGTFSNSLVNGLTQLNKVQILNISENPVQELPKKICYWLRKHTALRKLIISNMALTEFPPLPRSIKRCIARNNSFKTLPSTPYKKLRVVDLGRPEIETRLKNPNEFSRSLRIFLQLNAKITTLDLEKYDLKIFPSRLPIHLKTLNLSQNPFSRTSLNRSLHKNLKSLKQLEKLKLRQSNLDFLGSLSDTLADMDTSENQLTREILQEIARNTIIYRPSYMHTNGIQSNGLEEIGSSEDMCSCCLSFGEGFFYLIGGLFQALG